MRIKNLYIEKGVLKEKRTLEIQKRLKFDDIIICNSYQEVFNVKNQNFRIQKKNPSIIIARKKQNFLLEAPKGFSIGYKNNFYFSHMLNCLYDCKYCYLQGMFNSANYVIFINYNDFFECIKKKVESSNESFCFFSGYDCDSLAFEEYTGFVKFFLDKFKEIKNSVLEIRSKSTNIKCLLHTKPTPKVIPAFSLNSNEEINFLEYKTPRLKNRIDAMRKLQDIGWNVGLRFDPFIWMNEKTNIKFFLRDIFSSLNEKRIHSVTIGNFRMPKGYLKRILKIHNNDSFLLENYLKQDYNILKDNEKSGKDILKNIISSFVDESKIYLN